MRVTNRLDCSPKAAEQFITEGIRFGKVVCYFVRDGQPVLMERSEAPRWCGDFDRSRAWLEPEARQVVHLTISDDYDWASIAVGAGSTTDGSGLGPAPDLQWPAAEAERRGDLCLIDATALHELIETARRREEAANPDQPAKIVQRGRTPHHATLFMGVEAARYVHWHGVPDPPGLLAAYLQGQLERRFKKPPDERTVQRFAEDVAAAAAKPPDPEPLDDA